MWYVKNKRNGIKLKKFERAIIIPLFTEMINYKKANFSDSFLSYVKQLSDDKQREILIKVCEKKDNGMFFFNQVDLLLENYSEEDIRNFYGIYIKQNIALKKKCKNIIAYTVPDELKRIFIDYFYKHLFKSDKIWKMIDGETFNREIFHINFKLDNEIYVCPYCDMDSILNSGNAQIEHFWPKSKYPLLAMSALNLVSSCHSCNGLLEGKGKSTFVPVTMPYYEQIGDHVRFKFNKAERIVKILSEKQRVKNYISLMQLEKRYGKLAVYDRVERYTESVYATILALENALGIKMSEDDIKKYISINQQKHRKDSGLYFAGLSVFDDYDNYTDYINKISVSTSNNIVVNNTF